MPPIEKTKLLSLVDLIHDEWTAGLVQNSEVMSNARLGKEYAAKLVQLLPLDHPGYPLAFALYGSCANTLKVEEAEDLRQKGIAGIWDQHKAALVAVIKAYSPEEKQ